MSCSCELPDASRVGILRLCLAYPVCITHTQRPAHSPMLVQGMHLAAAISAPSFVAVAGGLTRSTTILNVQLPLL